MKIKNGEKNEKEEKNPSMKRKVGWEKKKRSR